MRTAAPEKNYGRIILIAVLDGITAAVSIDIDAAGNITGLF